jgi:hypothetical protein
MFGGGAEPPCWESFMKILDRIEELIVVENFHE